MPDEIRIEQFRLEDKPKLLAFLREAYADNPRMSDERFWDWHFPENPYVAADDLPVWVASSGDRIAGQLAAIPVELSLAGEERRARAMWILDLIVHENFRRRGIAKKLVSKAEVYCPVGLGVNTSEQHAPALLQSLGWRIVRKIPRYSKLLHAGNALPEIARIEPLRRTFNFLSAPFRPRIVENTFGDSGELRLLDGFDARFDELWRGAAPQWACSVARDAKFLDWQYRRQPGKKFDLLGCFAGEKLVGYAVVFVRKPGAGGAVQKAAITDLCWHPSDASKIIDTLLRGAVRLASERGAGLLVTDAVDRLLDERLRAGGFRPVKNPLQLMVKSNVREDLLNDSNCWFLTRGDADISIFEHPNL